MRLLPSRVQARLTNHLEQKAKRKDQICWPTHAAPPDLVMGFNSVEPPGQVVAYDAWTAHAEEVEALGKG